MRGAPLAQLLAEERVGLLVLGRDLVGVRAGVNVRVRVRVRVRVSVRVRLTLTLVLGRDRGQRDAQRTVEVSRAHLG